MINGTTASGIAFSIDEAKLDNMELVDALADLDDGDALAIPKITKLLLGNELRDKIYQQIREDDGRIPIEKFTAELTEILGAMGDSGKKS